MDREARRASDYDSYLAWAYLLYAASAVGRPETVVRELAARDVAASPERDRAWNTGYWESRFAIGAGHDSTRPSASSIA